MFFSDFCNGMSSAVPQKRLDPAATESQLRLKAAEANPQEDFEIKLSIDDFLEQYEKVAGKLGAEGAGKTGVKRLEAALDLLLETGLVAEGDGLEGRRYKASSYKIHDKSEISLQEIARKIRGQRKAMVASFKVSKNYKAMKPGEIYSYKSANAKKNPEEVTRSHCVMVVGYGLREGEKYLVFQDSHGDQFWEGGYGRVYLEDVLLVAELDL
uniref:Peptidase C1A papain C-terminal domain-containing protein n=1 Tax=Oryza punctata TaxID=4537 RepID=A0A0E0L7F7_ORYPU